jgi:tetratricopeptide (TPR) repeat protein
MKGLYLILCFLFVFAVQKVNAQRSNGLAVEGTVSVEKGSVDGAVIIIFQNGRKTGDYGIGSNGRFKLELDYGYDFILNFTRKDNFPIRIAVDTRVPQNVLQSDPRFPPFPLNIKLFTEINGIDKTFSENIVLRIYYSESVDNFISELFYNDTQIKQLIDQAILQSVQIGKVADNLDGIAKAEMAELRKEYDKLIKAAETEYNREEFFTALDGYKAASKIFPKEPYPHDRIAEINDLLAIMMLAQEREQALKDRLQALITQGDLQFDQKQYEDAKSSYQRALSVDANNAHSRDRIAKIDEILGQAQADKEYKSLITRGDNSFDELLYAEALKFYNQALQLKKDDQYPVQKIAQINSILKQQAEDAEKLKGYRESIFQAELNFEKQFYEKAISFYENALVHKPGDESALRKIDEIKSLMNMLAAKTLYDKQIKIADRAFQRKQYAEALPAYEEAASLLPSENYPKLQVEKIHAIFAEEERLLAEAEAEKVRLVNEAKAAEEAQLAALEAEKERQYTSTVASADSLFSLNQYENSRSAYQKALQIKPNEPRPQQRIEEIAQLLVQVAETQKAYDNAIALADQALSSEDFEAARLNYLQAQQVKPGENYPAERLAHIDSVLETRARLASEAEAEKARLAAEAEAAEQARLAALQAETDRQYNKAVTGADSLFNLKNYEASQNAYQNALQIKPGETHPQQRIGEIGQLLAQLADAQKAYDSAIALADGAFGREDFVAAKTAYSQAQQAKPVESYPAEKIAEIDSVVETRARLAAEAEAERNRLAAEAEAERLRLAAEAEAAEQARLAALQAEKDRQYSRAVAGADSLYDLNEHEASLTAYQNALQIKPGETRPQQRIEEIGQVLAQIADAQKAYDNAIALADEAMKNEDFEKAKSGYLQAQQAKPGESYPAGKIAEIDSVFETRARLAAEAEAEKARLAAEAEIAEQARLAALQAETDRQYSRAIANADSLFSLNEYETSRTAYQNALKLKPAEASPKQRIEEITRLMVQIADAQKAYDNAIAQADEALSREDFDAAKAGYRQAQQAKPSENYPADKIAEIDSVVETRTRLAAEAEAEQARLAAEAEAAERERLAALEAEKERQYRRAVANADSLFNLDEYEKSRTAFQTALQLKPEETDLQQKITEITKILNDRELARKEQEQLQMDYQNAVLAADTHFKNREYSESRAGYLKAQEIKPGEAYPGNKIKEIDAILNQKEMDEKYRSIILAADGFFKEEFYNEAETEYKNALAIKSAEPYPLSQLSKIEAFRKQQQEKLLAEQRATEEMERRKAEIEQRQQQLTERQDMTDAGLNQIYNEYISLADGFFDGRSYNVSRAWYYKALNVKPKENYPTQRISEINKLISSLQLNQRDRDYQNYVNLGDSTFRQNQLAVARGWYNRALTMNPDETYPKEQLQAISDLINERMAGRSGQLFESHMKNAAEAMESMNYNVARFWYNKALELRPDDAEAKEGLSKVP